MKREIIKFVDNTLTVTSEIIRDVGSEIDYELRMPEGTLLKALMLRCIVTQCRYMHSNGANSYLLEMNINNMSEKNRLILEAYMDFIKTEEKLDSVTVDHQALQEVFENFGEKFSQLYKESTLLLQNLKGHNTIY